MVRLEEPVAEKLAVRLRNDGRAHALFDIWRNLVNQPTALSFVIKPLLDSSDTFYSCADCGEPFILADLVFRHYRERHAEKATKIVEKTTEPPKGNFQFLAKCGLCRTPICPPNYHEFTSRLVAHHKERHDRVPFDEFRAKVVNVNAPEELDAWKKASSISKERHCALCDELVGDDRQVADHLKEKHADKILKPEPELVIHGSRVKQLECRDLRRLCTGVWDKEKKEPGHFLALLRHALNQRGLQLFRDIIGHQFACRFRPRKVSPRDQLTPRQQEILDLAAAPARRGHKPNRHTLRDHFAQQSVSEQEAYADIDVLMKLGLLVEFDNGQLDALGPGSHIATKP
jgi:hypothetical protein